MGTVLYNSLEALRIISVLISPFIPDTAEKIQNQIGLEEFNTATEWGRFTCGSDSQQG